MLNWGGPVVIWQLRRVEMCRSPSLAGAMPHHLYAESLAHPGQGDSSWGAANGVRKPPLLLFCCCHGYTQYKAMWTERAAADEQVTCVWHLVSTVGEEESYLISRIDI